jgi:type II secretory pathway pseudopilin PulG
MRAGERGFSLIEALAVAGVVAVLVVVAMPRLVVPDTLQTRAAARQLAADLRLAQRLAIARRADHVLEFAPMGGPYTSYTLRRQGGEAEPDFPKSVPSEVRVTGTQQFTFRPDGSAASGGGITLAAGGASVVVQVTAATGRVAVSGP